MKKSLIATLLALCLMSFSSSASPRDAEWRAVDEAVRKGLPKSAIEALEPIIAGALADRAYPEAIRAIGRRIALEGNIEGNKPEEKIVRLELEIAKAPPEMKPVMEAILAHWYWHYFQQNRWRFHQRTETAAEPGSDIRTWDLARILAEIDRHFTAALADEQALRATPITEYDGLLERGTASDLYRPTLWDFLVYEALEFYQAGEQGGLQAEDTFELDAGRTPVFAPVAQFVAWTPTSADASSPIFKAVLLHQKLLRIHAADTERSAFLDADLARLRFGANQATGEDKSDRYRAALERLAGESAGHEIEFRVLSTLAQAAYHENDFVRAHEIARRVLARAPQSYAGAECENLIAAIEAKSARIQTDAVWDAASEVQVHYRNVGRVFFRAIPIDFESYLRRSRWGLGNFDTDRRRELRGAEPALAWEADLPATSDFKERSHGVAVPKGLRPGFYGILASHDASFAEADNQLSVAYVWVSELALVVQTRTDGSALSGFVLEAGRGEPVADAQVRVWHRDREGRYRAMGRVATDKDGRFVWANAGDGIILVADHAGRMVASVNEAWARDGRDPDRADTQTVFFTDRAIYRPGQSIHYKGVSVRYDQKAAKYSAIDRLDLTVVFNDPNGKEIARATHRTNEYGSFSGVFTAPRDRLMGRMSIQVLNRPSSTSFSVEEYKRPKFQVEIAAPAEAPRLDAPVVIKGKATAYTGASIGGATVAWRVERSVRLPGWCWWWQPPANKAVAHGRAVTAADGTFEMRFDAVPDRSVPAKNEPVFAYTIHADVTDTTGETRSDERTVRAGYTALAATISVDEWQTPAAPVVLALRTTSLDGEGQAAEGRVVVHALAQPERVQRAPLQRQRFWWHDPSGEPPNDPSNPDSWAPGAIAASFPFKTDTSGVAKVEARLQAGIYRASVETKDRFGRVVTARQTIRVVDPAARALPVKVAQIVAAPSWSVEPGQALNVLWGTGYESGRAYVELECDGRTVRSGWTEAGRTQALIEQKITEDMRGGLTLRLTYVRENRAHLVQRVVEVPWSNKQLSVTWESFRSKLEPGAKETWTAIVSGPQAERASAEMVAALYDASLDQYLAHSWAQAFPVFRREFMRAQTVFQNQAVDFRVVENRWSSRTRSAVWSYRAFPAELTTNMQFYEYERGLMARAMPAAAPVGVGGSSRLAGIADSVSVVTSQFLSDTGSTDNLPLLQYTTSTEVAGVLGDFAGMADIRTSAPDLTQVTARKNLNETAFFFPHLTSGADGTVRMTFTMPEALTEWRFLGFAHDAKLRAGYLEGRAVTAKDLMVEPNPPRFVREGDAIEFTVKVSNQSDAAQSGRVKLTFADAATLASVDAALGNQITEQVFEVPSKQSRSYSWRVTIPDGMGFLTYKAVGASAQASDGEEGFLPVLSRRILVTESLPLPMRGKGTRKFELAKLVESGGSTTLRHQSLTVQMVSQPAWYAVMALPYLMEYPYECSEQVFNRYYANTLARHIAGSDPKIRRIFDLWKNTPALDSPLEKNQDLKSVMLEETPWLRDAADESQARRNVGLLFDGNRLDEEAARTLQKLAERQLEDGLWPWFPGGRPSEFISLYIVTGFGRLRHLGAEIDVAPAVRALGGLDAWMDRRYRDIRPEHRDNYVPAHVDCIYLYGRSFFLRDQPIDDAHREAVEYFQRQARRHWLKTDCRMCQAQAAIALQRFGDTETPRAILRSLQERSVSNDELGMFWRDTEASWWWYRAPIETQATMIEAFAEVAQDAAAVEAMQVWLLKQKQTQDWKTTKATADAVYALLLRGKGLVGRANPPGEPWLGGDASPYLGDALVEVALGGETIKPDKVEAGTGFYEQKFVRGEVRPEMGHVTVTKVDDGVSWGSVHWQYLEDMAKVTPHEGTPLKLKKTLWVKETTDKGPVLRPVSGAVAVGDELVVRIELRTDRDMEYVHLKDQRGSGTEPVNVLSRYRYQDGLGYYESTRDTASHFFIEYLPKGTYVFEYSTRVQLRGSYQSGIAEIQCMYAPEFNSHSESLTLEVR